MCEQTSNTPRKFAAACAASGATGIAKASPGLLTSGVIVAGYSVETWVSILTCAYLLCMIVGSLPKVLDFFRYLWRLCRKPKPAEVLVTVKDCREVADKIEGGK